MTTFTTGPGGNGSKTSDWYFGYATQQVTVVCSGGGKSDSVTKTWNPDKDDPS